MKQIVARRAAACVIAAAVAATALPAVALGQGGASGGFTYLVAKDGSAVVTGCSDSNTLTLAVPETLDGHVVKGLLSSAFHSQIQVKTLKLPKTIEYIRSNLEYEKSDDGIIGLSGLEAIEVDSQNSFFTAVDGVLFSADMKHIVEYPSGRTETSYSIPEGVEVIEANCFDVYDGLESVSLPASLKMMSNNRLGSMQNLREIVLSKGNASYSLIDGVLFDRAGKVLVSCPGGVERASYSIPKGTTKILPGAFFQHDRIRNVSIPASVEIIGGSNFTACDALEGIRVEQGNKQYASESGVLFSKDMKTLLAYPAGRAVESYDVPSTVTAIANTAFNESTIQALSVGPSVTTIEPYSLCSMGISKVFVSSKGLYDKIAGNRQYIIPYDANRPEQGGTTVVYSPGMVGVIDGGTGKEPVLNKSFKAAAESGKAVFTLTAKYKGSKAAMAANSAKVSYAGEVRVDFYPLGKNRSISFNTLRYNNRLYKITAVNKGVLKANKYVAAVALGNNVSKVAAGAFQGCRNLKAVYMGSGLKSIGKSAFYKCPKLASVSVASTALKAGKVGASAFRGTAKKAAFQVPKSKLKAYKSLFQKAGASKKASFKKA